MAVSTRKREESPERRQVLAGAAKYTGWAASQLRTAKQLMQLWTTLTRRPHCPQPIRYYRNYNDNGHYEDTSADNGAPSGNIAQRIRGSDSH